MNGRNAEQITEKPLLKAETERLILDEIRESDKEDYFHNISHDRKVLETFICRYADTLEEFDFSAYPGRRDVYAIRLKETGRLIGILSYFGEKEDSCEIGYGIGSAYWNRGYATEAVGRFLEYLFREKGMRTVYASFFTGNEASRRIMEKCGMRYSRFSEKELTYLDVPRDLTYYEISRTDRDNQTLIGFWDKALSVSEAEREELQNAAPESWKDLAPSEKLFEAACSLGKKKKVLDYGCGSAWAGIIAAKSGCPDVTAADAAPGAVRAAAYSALVYGAEKQLNAVCADPGWLKSVPSAAYDGFFCSNVLDVIPTETAREIIRESARITSADACVIIGLNFYLSPEAAAARGLELADGTRLYVDGVLRLVSRTDEEWAELFSPWYVVEKLTHFAWPGEKTESRRLFYLKKPMGAETDPENTASQRVLEKCGFRPLGITGEEGPRFIRYREDAMKDDPIIRPERPGEYGEVENLVRESFWNVYRPGCSEHYVIHVLRDDPAFVKELDLVMEQDGRLIGQNMFMKTVIEADDGRIIPVLTMGPIGITPELKRKGCGKKLLDYSLEKAAELGFGAVLFEGNIGFYGKSGFDYARKFGIRYHDLPEGADDSFFLCRELIPGYLDGVTGVYQTPKGYYVDDADVEVFDKSFPPKKKLKLPGQLFG